MTVAELLARISAAELSEWMAFDALEREPDPAQAEGGMKAGFAALAARSRKRKR